MKVVEGSFTGLSPTARAIYRGFQGGMIGMALLSVYFAFRDTPSKGIQLGLFLGVLCAFPIALIEYERRKIESQRYSWDKENFRVENKGIVVLSCRWSEIAS